jgi:hypothetical protein
LFFCAVNQYLTTILDWFLVNKNELNEFEDTEYLSSAHETSNTVYIQSFTA